MAKNKDKKEDPEISIEPGYLTLKEASLISSYSPDYIGQLIRQHKIEGKQVYSNVAWLASEESLRTYLESRGKELAAVPEHDELSMPDFFRPLLYTIIFCSVLFLLILMHVFSVSLDRALSASIEERAISDVESL